MEAYWGVEVYLHGFSIMGPGERSRYPLGRKEGGLDKVGLDEVVKRKIPSIPLPVMELWSSNQ